MRWLVGFSKLLCRGRLHAIDCFVSVYALTKMTIETRVHKYRIIYMFVVHYFSMHNHRDTTIVVSRSNGRSIIVHCPLFHSLTYVHVRYFAVRYMSRVPTRDA